MDLLAPTYVNHAVRVGQTIENHIDGIFSELADVYIECNSGKNLAYFHGEFIEVLWASLHQSNGDTEHIDAILKKENIPCSCIRDYRDALLLCMSAKVTLSEGLRERGWSLVAEANFNLGRLFAVGNIRRNLELVESSVKKRLSKSGGDKKSKANDSLKKIAFELAINEAPGDNKKWKSANNMGLVIYQRLLIEAPKRGVKVTISKDRGPVTVKNWLMASPGIEQVVDAPKTKRQQQA